MSRREELRAKYSAKVEELDALVKEMGEKYDKLCEEGKEDTLKIKPVSRKRLQRVMTKDDSSSSLLADIRGAVDANLSAMHQAIANDLYRQLGLEPRMLHHIDAYTISNGDGTLDKGFMYAYVDEDRAFANKTWAEVSESGKVKRIIRTK